MRYFGVLLGALVCFSSICPPAFAVNCPNDTVCETYTYDVHGRLIEVEEVEDNSGTETTETVEYTYDNADNRTQKKTTT